MDMALQVWLDTRHHGEEVRIVPYVKSAVAQGLSYRIDLTKVSTGGRSSISQQGSVSVDKDKAVPLSNLTLGTASEISACQLGLRLENDAGTVDTYDFDCAADIHKRRK